MNTRRHAAAHVFVDDLEQPRVDDTDRHHLLRVLRLRDGEIVTTSDGRGSWRECRFRAGDLDVVGPVFAEPTTARGAVVVFALTKGDKPEVVVQKLTEIGVDRIVLFESSRSVVRWDADKADRNLERLRRVAREAAMQSRRVTIPVVGPVMSSVEQVVAEFGDRVALAEPDCAPVDPRTEVIVVGPEGGFTDVELAACPRHVGLSAAVLRAETAAIVAGVTLVQFRDGAVR